MAWQGGYWVRISFSKRSTSLCCWIVRRFGHSQSSLWGSALMWLARTTWPCFQRLHLSLNPLRRHPLSLTRSALHPPVHSINKKSWSEERGERLFSNQLRDQNFDFVRSWGGNSEAPNLGPRSLARAQKAHGARIAFDVTHLIRKSDVFSWPLISHTGERGKKGCRL